MAEMEGAQRTVWEILIEMERFKYRAGDDDLGGVALVVDLAKVSERVSLPAVWAWATHFLPKDDLAGALLGTSNAGGGCNSKDVWAEPLLMITAILSGSTWSCLLPRRTH